MQRFIDYAADIVGGEPNTLFQATRRLLVFLILAIAFLELSRWTGLKSMLFILGYVWGSIYTYSAMRKRR